jgi:hypothetical protein
MTKQNREFQARRIRALLTKPGQLLTVTLQHGNAYNLEIDNPLPPGAGDASLVSGWIIGTGQRLTVRLDSIIGAVVYNQPYRRHAEESGRMRRLVTKPA